VTIHTTYGSLEDLFGSVERLLNDIHNLRSNGSPPIESLEQAPHLERWFHSTRPAPCLEGMVTGHPLLGSLIPVRTSELVMLDKTAGWARTWSRYYQLGTPG
jgi:hypothetical protein